MLHKFVKLQIFITIDTAVPFHCMPSSNFKSHSTIDMFIVLQCFSETITAMNTTKIKKIFFLLYSSQYFYLAWNAEFLTTTFQP